MSFILRSRDYMFIKQFDYNIDSLNVQLPVFIVSHGNISKSGLI